MVEKKDTMTKAIEQAKPLLAKLSFGGVVGYCSGYAAKTIGKAVALLAGMSFIALQSAVYAGYINVDWNKVKDDVEKQLDTTGDGQLDVEDAKKYWEKAREILTDKLPSAGGFSLGFLYGVTN
eukprot:CAMPEP_0118696196 /NCGR_PEP_ID=MMETSP0800-20121206/13693_1 /TAXON_ID=210618 ORGANISM="Striatella unipunctata, Strain CCMP2910" /NCGR_SAMPLE_ID=MMETSP0800 /ASSEMBLY_ACC=CAM_ASM_000638 /LENGTH=122 /DNA_ID=CAMNT_0006595243 /DNA_START=24 /DNA_END=392 /DNA_ORIENTATION=+